VPVPDAIVEDVDGIAGYARADEVGLESLVMPSPTLPAESLEVAVSAGADGGWHEASTVNDTGYLDARTRCWLHSTASRS